MKALYGGNWGFEEIVSQDDFDFVDYIMLINYEGNEFLLISQLFLVSNFLELLMTFAEYANQNHVATSLGNINKNYKKILRKESTFLLKGRKKFARELASIEAELVKLKKETVVILQQAQIDVISIGGWAAKPGNQTHWDMIEYAIGTEAEKAGEVFRRIISPKR